MDPDSFARIPNIIITKREFIYNVHVDEFLHHASSWRWYQRLAGPCHAAPAEYITGDMADASNRFTRLLLLGRMAFNSPSGKRYIIADTPIYFQGKNRSIATNVPITSIKQELWRSCSFLGTELVSAICEAGSTDGYERPYLSLLMNYIQQPIYSANSRKLSPQSAGTHGRRMRSNDVAGCSKTYQCALAALVPVPSAPFKDYPRVRRSDQIGSPTESTSSVFYRLASGPATLLHPWLRDRSKFDANNLNSFFQSGGSAVGSKESDALGKLFENYRGLCNQDRTALTKQTYILLDEKTDEVDTIGVEGTMQYFEHLGINLESVEFLVPMEIVQAPALGEIGKEGFVTGWRRIG